MYPKILNARLEIMNIPKDTEYKIRWKWYQMSDLFVNMHVDMYNPDGKKIQVALRYNS